MTNLSKLLYAFSKDPKKRLEYEIEKYITKSKVINKKVNKDILNFYLNSLENGYLKDPKLAVGLAAVIERVQVYCDNRFLIPVPPTENTISNIEEMAIEDVASCYGILKEDPKYRTGLKKIFEEWKTEQESKIK